MILRYINCYINDISTTAPHSIKIHLMFFVFYIFCPQFVLVLFFCFSVFCFFQQMKFALHTYIIELFLDFGVGNEMITYMHLNCLFSFAFEFVLNFTTIPCSLTWTLGSPPLLHLFPVLLLLHLPVLM